MACHRYAGISGRVRLRNVAKGKVVDEAAVGTGNLTRAFTAALRLWPALMPQQPVAMESDDLTQLVVLMRQEGMAAPACD